MRMTRKALRVFGGREGSFLVESIVALSLVVVGILGIVVLLTRSLGLTANVVQRAVATYLAAEGIEVTKNIIDTAIAKGGGWSSISSIPSAFEVEYGSASPAALSGDARPLRFNPADGIYSYGGVQETPFRRTVTASVAGDKATVNAVVKWSVRGTDETLNLEDHFWNWRQ